MSETKLYENMMQIGAGIEACLKKGLVIPALVLLYSAIDITSWLASDDPNGSVRDYFTRWVQNYMLPSSLLECSALEIYSARCGLVHTLTPDSRLSEQGGIRRIAYAWGTVKSSDLQSLIDRTGWADRLVSVKVEEMYEAWRLGLLAFTEELKQDPQKAVSVYERADKFFEQLSGETLNAILGKGS